MHAPRLPLILTTLLLIGSGLLMLLLGNVLPLLAAGLCLLVAGLFGNRPGSAPAWVSTLGGITIFLAGTPLTGSPPESLLVSAVMALYFICWVQQIKTTALSPLAPTGPVTLAFYGTILLAYLLLRSQVFPLPYIVSIFVATLFILTNLALWEMGRRSRLTQAAQVQSPSLPDWLGRACVMAAILIGTFLLFRLPLPWIANGALDLADELNLTYQPPSSQNRQQSDRDGPRDGRAWNPEAAATNDDNASESANDDFDPTGIARGFGRSGELPEKADLELSDFARCHLEIPDEAQAKAALGRPLYLRSHTFSVFQDDAWIRGPDEGRWITDDEDGKADDWVTISKSKTDQAIQQKLFLYNHLSGGPLLGMPNLLAFKGPGVFHQSDDFFSTRQDGDISYEIVSAPVRIEEVMRSRTLEAGQAPPHCLEKAQGLTFRDMDNLLLAPIQKPDLTLKQKLASLRKLFEDNYTYSTKIENPGDDDPLANFLFHEKRGYCDFYAQAGAHMLRGIGVPSRVAYGFVGGLYDPALGLYTFRHRDAHAWAEMFLKDHGWVPFDLVPSGQGAHRPAETLPTDAETDDPTARFLKAEKEARSEGKAQRSPISTAFTRDWERWLEELWILRYLNLILGLVILGLLATYAFRRWQQRGDQDTEKRGAGRAHRREAPGYFRDFCELFAAAGLRRAPGETLKEYFRNLKQAHLFRDQFDPLLEYHYQVEYENAERSKRREKQFQREIRAFEAIKL